MGNLAFFLLVTSPLWMLYIVVAIESPARVPVLWIGIIAIVISWLAIERVNSWMAAVSYTAPGAVSLLMAGMALHIAKKDSERSSKPANREDEDAAE